MTLLIRRSVGPEVKQLQENLNTVGVPVDVDGIYGAATEHAVQTFQKGFNLEADGKYGPATDAKMQEALEQARAAKPGA